jgi:hypothetical protein
MCLYRGPSTTTFSVALPGDSPRHCGVAITRLAPVRLGGKWGYIDPTGALRIPVRFDDAFAFSERRARVVVDGLAGFIDEAGAWVAEPA